ncbi:TIGR02281 family clan AA aspartic protease [Sphingobium sp. DEHP117]|jgi:aspartyl protease family protein|uniref:retropepsin-like aspartic protease family protein n=1 Tax=Sphingobium sp. DEHP117 TaxID=2993436 RepID=UPI0027D6B03E|nr:TIGR02281 family clan AA aspartic protease [Sphingobium sp. DEHP117]MDQ4419761.1 TIGR02281 family clan AA aspartic protease [Sphingobium sp. DEHP117]
MSADQGTTMIWWLLAALLPVSALLARRISLGGTLAMALGWVAIFLGALALFSYGQEFTSVALHVKKQVLGEPLQRAEGQRLHIRQAPDGHFWVTGEINGTSARFLIDSGATVTALSDDVAMKAGLNIDSYAPGMAMQTANGVVMAKRSSITGLAVGPIRTSDLPIVVSDRFNGVNVLGMNFLSRLKSWRVENGEMVLEP